MRHNLNVKLKKHRENSYIFDFTFGLLLLIAIQFGLLKAFQFNHNQYETLVTRY